MWHDGAKLLNIKKKTGTQDLDEGVIGGRERKRSWPGSGSKCRREKE